MQRHREIAATPFRSASEAWATSTGLLGATLERSSAIPAGSVEAALTPMRGLGPALIAGGHLETNGLVLVDSGIHLTINFVTGEKAFDVAENLSPVPGGSTATANWMLYVPAVEPLADAVSAIVSKSPHLSSNAPPSVARNNHSSAGASAGLVDLSRFRGLGDQT